MLGVTYKSEAAHVFSDAEVEELAEKAAEFNASVGITGYLYYAHPVFLQYIEGETEAIESLMEQIAKDPRHTIVATAKEEDRVSRRFPSWSMRLFQPGRDPEINLQSIWSDMLSIEALDWPGERSNSIWRCIEKISSTQA